MRANDTDTKSRSGASCRQAKTGPVVIEKVDQTAMVPLCTADDQRLQPPAVASVATRRERFTSQHRDWLHTHNRQHDAVGLWNDDLRLW